MIKSGTIEYNRLSQVNDRERKNLKGRRARGQIRLQQIKLLIIQFAIDGGQRFVTENGTFEQQAFTGI